MKCEKCGERNAQIHLTQIVDNSVTTVHLCEECASNQGVQTGVATGANPLNDFVASIGLGGGTISEDEAATECPTCNSSLKDFRDSGKLGCADCYETFHAHLKNLLRRLHGSSHHAGKYYFAESEESDHDRKTTELRKQLKRAIEAENFELAAELRDQLQVLE
jgi:protein arginine kinase activator